MKLIQLLVCYLSFFSAPYIYGQMLPNFVCTNEPTVNMAIFDGLMDWNSGVSYSGGKEVLPADETTRGAIIIVNKNDTDGDGIEDYVDPEVVSLGANGRNEIDLAKLIIEKPPGMISGETVIITVNNFARVKFYNHPTKLVEETDLHTIGSIVYQSTDLPKILYIESISPSTVQGDIVVTMDYKGNLDIVHLTAVTVDFRRSWLINATCVCPDNIDPTVLIGPQALFPIVNTIMTVQSFDGSNYGFGHFYEDPINPGTDQFLGGRALYEFEVTPGGINYNAIFGLNFDITRQIEAQQWKFKGSLDAPIPECISLSSPGCVSGVELFPYHNGHDNELPNDDNSANDEHNTPPLLYSFDSPGLMGMGSSRFGIIQDNFHEFVRVSLSPTAWGENLIGSRISEKVSWHMFINVRTGQSNNFELDPLPTSNSGPLTSAPFGWNGTSVVNILANPINRSYWALFDVVTDTWQLTDATKTGNIGGAMAWVNIAVPPTIIKQWTLEDPMRARLIITEDTSTPPIPFGLNNVFAFTIFDSANKANEIALGLKVSGY
ncbi:MAG: hypothetical protein J0M29_16815 [Chitinophagales bacterium]|nr:hypothetical protein [Chitinophagales bacterium]